MTQTDPQDGAPRPSDVVRAGLPSVATRESGSRRDLWNQMDQSSIMSVELIAAILVWGGVGWLIDGWLGTTPWLFGIGVMVGFGAGLYLVWLRSERDQQYPNAAAAARRTRDDLTED